jgi:hypothetical protein
MDRTTLVELLRAIVLSDRSRPYEHREMRAADAERPPAGARWMTPRELAERALRGLGEESKEPTS